MKSLAVIFFAYTYFCTADLTVMQYNTYLISVGAPALGKRAEEIANWFLSLPFSAIPDVVVFNEMWQDLVVQRLCSTSWDSDVTTPYTNITNCDVPNSHFSMATPNANDAADFVPIPSGVVMLAKRGNKLQWTESWDHEFAAASGTDVHARKGAQLVKIVKDNDTSQTYYILGTHMQAGRDTVTRAAQIREAATFVLFNVPAGETVIFAGDMNTGASELPTLFSVLTGVGMEPGTVRPNGFWSLHSEPYSSSNNAFRSWARSSRIDWIFPSLVTNTSAGMNKTFTTASKTMIYQDVRVRSSTCYALNLRDTKQWLSDLSDHDAVFAKICNDAMSCTWTDTPVVLPAPTCPSTPPTDVDIADSADCSPGPSDRFCASRVCDSQISRCVPCTKDGAHDTCASRTWAKVCDIGAGLCVSCLSSDDCEDNVCDTDTKRCVACRNDGSTNTCETRAIKKFCDDNTGSCVESSAKSFHQTLWAVACVLSVLY